MRDIKSVILFKKQELTFFSDHFLPVRMSKTFFITDSNPENLNNTIL